MVTDKFRSLVAECLDSQKAVYSLELLARYVATDLGKKDVEEAARDMTLGPIALFLLAGMKHHRQHIPIIIPSSIDASVVRALVDNLFKKQEKEDKKLGLSPPDKCRDQLVRRVVDNAYGSFGQYIKKHKRNCTREGWLRLEALQTTFPPGKIIQIQSTL